MQHAAQERANLRQACKALVVGLPLLGAGAGSAEARDYDRENQYGAIAVHESMQAKFPVFDRTRLMNAVTVNDIDRAPFLPDGVRVGNYMLFPEVSASVVKADNMFTLKDRPADIRNEIAANLNVISQLPRHMFDFMLSGRAVSYQTHDERNFADGAAHINARIDINSGHALVGNFMTKIDHEEDRSDETPATAKRSVEIWDSKADVGFVRSVGRLTTHVGASAEHKEYHAAEGFDGGRVSQSYRDTDFYTSYLKTRYQLSPGYTVMARFAGLAEQNRGSLTFNRSNHGVEATVGMEFNVSSLFQASVEGGLTTRDYDQKALVDITTGVFDSRFAWLMMPSLTVYGKALRRATQTNAIGASGRIDTVAGGSLEYELQRNIVLKGGAQFTHMEFMGTSRIDGQWLFNASAQYFYNKNIYFTLEYIREKRDSNEIGYDYQDNKIMASVKFRH
jgi:hypothetical protein